MPHKRQSRMHFAIDQTEATPIYKQLIEQIEEAIAQGTLRGGDRLPTVRKLAVDIHINPNTVRRAYRELEIRGIVVTHQGTGTFVSERKPEISDKERGAILLRRLRKAKIYRFSL